MTRRTRAIAAYIFLSIVLAGCDAKSSELNKAYVSAANHAEAAITADQYTLARHHYEKAIADVNRILDESGADLAVDLVSGEKTLSGLTWSEFSRKADQLNRLASAEESLMGAMDYLLARMESDKSLRNTGKLYVDKGNFGHVPYERMKILLPKVDRLSNRQLLLSSMIATDINTSARLRGNDAETISIPVSNETIAKRLTSNISRLQENALNYIERDGYSSAVIRLIEKIGQQPLEADTAIHLAQVIDSIMEVTDDNQRQKLELQLIKISLFHKTGLTQRLSKNYNAFLSGIEEMDYNPFSRNFMVISIQTAALIQKFDLVNWIFENNQNDLVVDHVKSLYYAMYYADLNGKPELANDYAQRVFKTIKNHERTADDYYLGVIRELYGLAGETAIQMKDEEELDNVFSELTSLRLMIEDTNDIDNMPAYHQRKALYGMLRAAGEKQKVQIIRNIRNRLSRITNSKKRPQNAVLNTAEVARAYLMAGDLPAAEKQTERLLDELPNISAAGPQVKYLSYFAILHDRFGLDMSGNVLDALIRFVHKIEPPKDFWNAATR